YLCTRRPPPTTTLFPYTTLFRSDYRNDDPGKPHSNTGDVPPLTGDRGHVRPESEQHTDRNRDRNQRCLQQREHCSFEQEWQQRRSEEHTSELQSRFDLVCRLLLE